ncbi:uncharacterized protein [Triticum aestivum]|uniref:uncharacterized protein n=1 Tax=Triticum aestivum TaxID=4565 RepID=UPI001D002DDB|nr:uncharacterized protein LOC123077078 [Triticum aestivum]
MSRNAPRCSRCRNWKKQWTSRRVNGGPTPLCLSRPTATSTTTSELNPLLPLRVFPLADWLGFLAAEMNTTSEDTTRGRRRRRRRRSQTHASDDADGVTRRRSPPLLGLFHQCKDDIVFTPIMDRPDRIRPKRFDLHLDSHNMGAVQLLDCRHGRVLLTDKRRDELILCDPIIGEQRLMAVPPEFVRKCFNGTVLCAAIDHDHVHESCHSSPFKVVLISYLGGDNQHIVCVYSSETRVWGDIISTTASYHLSDYGIPGLLVGNALYWLLDIIGAGILKFDLDEQSLAVIEGPLCTMILAMVVASSRLRMARLASPYCLTLTYKCGRGISFAMVLPHGCYGRPLTCVQFLGSLNRFKERGHL